MNRMRFFHFGVVAALILAAVGAAPAQSLDTAKAAQPDADKLVYADFQNLQNGRPVSERGGLTRLNWYAENMANAPRVRGLENADPPAPAGARLKAGDSNIA